MQRELPDRLPGLGFRSNRACYRKSVRKLQSDAIDIRRPRLNGNARHDYFARYIGIRDQKIRTRCDARDFKCSILPAKRLRKIAGIARIRPAPVKTEKRILPGWKTGNSSGDTYRGPLSEAEIESDL